MASSEHPLAGRLALVTGCSRRIGIGFAVADRLASLGADLLVHAYRPYDKKMPWGADPDELDLLLSDLRRHGTRVESVEANLTEPGAPERVVAAAFRHLDLGFRIKKRKYSLIGLGCLILSTLLWWRVYHAEFWQVDRCLDQGGHYNYQTQLCEFE